jgi:DNA-binding LacI/PurR family transcriptional regulator
MKDVAAMAGVTPTVVSRVLHGRALTVRVSDATADRVRVAARKLGYRVNVMARNFRERQTMMIGVLHGIGFGRPKFGMESRYFALLMDGIVDSAFDHGYSVTLCPKLMGENPEDAMADGRFDGLVWYSTLPSRETRKMLEGCTVPMVLIHTHSSEFGGKFPAVMCDNHQGIGLAVDHLVELGHTRIGFALESDVLFGEAAVRRDAFLWHMGRYGLTASDDDLIDTRHDHVGLHTYLSQRPSHTAVIASNDEIAAAFTKNAKCHGLSIPEDLSVIGFDSTGYCEEQRPALTSVSQPLATMGRSAVDLLVQSINGQAPDPPVVMFPCGLDIRGSTQSTANR